MLMTTGNISKQRILTHSHPSEAAMQGLTAPYLSQGVIGCSCPMVVMNLPSNERDALGQPHIPEVLGRDDQSGHHGEPQLGTVCDSAEARSI